MRDADALDEERVPEIGEYEAEAASDPLAPLREINLGHDFHEIRQDMRFTISPQARDDVLDKLLALNHHRDEQEVQQGLHANNRSPKKASPAVTSSRAEAGVSVDDAPFGSPDALFCMSQLSACKSKVYANMAVP